MERITGAVIGCGRMGAFTSELMKKYGPKCLFPLSHIEALQEIPDMDLVAISDINKVSLEKAALKYEIDSCYQDYEILLKEKKIDILCIATRTSERIDIIKKAISHDIKAIHLEKPLCNSMEQLLEIKQLVNESRSLLSYGTIRRYLDIYKKAKTLVDSGKFGNLLQIQIDFGSAPLYWTHAHSVDLILFFAGKRNLRSVQAYMSNLEKGKEEYFIESDPIIEQACMYFDHGVIGNISKIPGMNVTLGCEKALITVKSNGSYITISDSLNNNPYLEFPGTIIQDDCDTPQGTYAAISSLKDRMRSAYSPDLNDHIFLGQRALFGFIQSALEGSRKIKLEEIHPKTFVKGKTGNLYA